MRRYKMASENSDGQSLRKGRLGVAGIVFFVVAASAPLVGMTGAVPVAMLAGNLTGTPGTYLAVGLALLLFSVGYAAMSNKVTNAGAFFAYVGKAFGPKAGVASAFASIVGYITIQLAIYGFFGGLMAGQMAAMGIDIPWYVWTLVAWAVVTGLSLLSVDVGAKVLGTLMIAELLSLLIVAVAILVNGGPDGGVNLAASFAPENILMGGITGGAGIAIAFAFASFIGFEATAIYGEESVNPKKTVAKATYWAIGIITALFAIVSLAMVTGMGATTLPDKIIEYSSVEGVPLANPAGVLFALSDQYVGSWLTQIMGWLVVSSLFAGLLAFQNATSRYFFAMGRSGVLGKSFGRTNASGAPEAGVILTSALAAAVVILFAVTGLDPILNLFFWMSSITAISIFFVEILVSLAVVVFFMREGGENVWKSKIAPIASAIILSFGLYLLMSRFNLLAGTAPEGVDPSLPESAWALSSFGWFLVLLPFIAAVLGLIVAQVRNVHHGKMVDDVLS
jgi:amino acid transporter